MLSFFRASPVEHIGAGSPPAPPDVLDEPVPATAPTFDEVYEEHFDYVWRSARRLGVRPLELDDVVQDVFLIVHQILPRYESRNTIRGWLFAIVVRVVLRHHRTIRRHAVSAPESELIDALPDTRDDAGPEHTAVAGENMRLFEALLDGLDPEKRAVLVLTVLEQRSAPEVAEILQMNVNTVGSRLRVAREQIQAGLARHQARDRRRLK